jgi:hypothetical protein
VEEGVLTEEEFSAKKREILGLEPVGALPGETAGAGEEAAALPGAAETK